jgi:hypothetical protein
MIATAIFVGSILIALAITASAGALLLALAKVSEDFEGRFHMCFALASMQVTMQLEDHEQPVPEWLKSIFEDDGEEDQEEETPPRKLTLVKRRKDYPEE